jgi:hypothetical protein
MKLAAADEASTAAEAVPSASPGLAANHCSGTLRTRFCAVFTAATWCVFLVLLRAGVDTHQRIVSLHMHLHQNESAVLLSNKTYWGEEDWRIPPSPPPGVPKLDRDGCFTKLHQQNYTVVAKCGRPNNVRPQPAQPDEVLHILPGCVFTTDSRCCAKADGAVWDLRNSANLGINAAQLADFRSARPKQIWVAESTETYQSISTGTRPLGDASIMKLMDYAAYFGISADFPLLPNYDYRNEVYRDLIAWPGRNVALRTAQPLQVLLRGKKGDILYLSSDCVTAHGSKRDRFVSNVFMSHLKVDSLGKCVRTTQQQYDKHSSATNFRASSAAMIASYRFRLVNPNSICEDYVVEKFAQTVVHGTIPIVLGAPNAKRFDPGLAAGVHAAAIYVIDFDGIVELSDYIIEVATQPSLYQKFFEWVGKTAPVWPSHYVEIEKRRRGARSFLQFACERAIEGRPNVSGLMAPRNCQGSWGQYFRKLGKNMTKWQATSLSKTRSISARRNPRLGSPAYGGIGEGQRG